MPSTTSGRGGAKSRQKLAAPRRVSSSPHGTGNCAPTLTSNTSKASSASMGSQVAPGWTPSPGPRAHDITGLADEICLIFFDQRHTLGHAVTAAQRVCGGVECKVEKLANGRGSNVQARITGGIINIHLTVIIRNSTIGKYHVGNIADALPATRRDQKSGRFGNHFPGLFQIGHKQVDHIAQALRIVAHAMGNVQPAPVPS